MKDETATSEQLNRFSFLGDTELQREVLHNGEIVSFNKGDVVVREGQYVKFLPIVLEGSIRVFQQKNERELLLYYVTPQQTCTMSLAAAYFDNKSTSFGVAVEPTDAFVFPSHLIMEWQLKYPSWNKYVMRMFRTRYDELLKAFETVTFEHIDARITQYLKRKMQQENSRTINISHQRLANEIGTTRVVVSRILKQFEKDKKIKLSRGAIRVL